MKMTVSLFSALLWAAPAAAQEEAPPEPPPAERTTRFETVDRLELDTTSIIGNRELPKVMYVVPWKKADLGDLSGRPATSLVDEVLSPVDRDVFRREVSYFQALAEGPRAGAQAEKSVTPAASQP